MKTLITIDFDCFVPEDPMWDLGHQESLLFLDVMWQTRMHLVDRMRTDGGERSFWPWLRGKADLNTCSLAVSDSHAFAYHLAGDADTIISFDAHHDCFAHPKGDKGVFCDNWIRRWMQARRSRRLVWVRPAWQTGDAGCPADLRDRIDVVPFSSGVDITGDIGDLVHVCRSGCWVPPWLDETFVEFVQGFGRPLEHAFVMQTGDWHPFRQRWDAEKLRACREAFRVQKALIRDALRPGYGGRMHGYHVQSAA